MSEQRARHLESVGGPGAERHRRKTIEIPHTRKIELGDLPSAYRPSVGFRARSASVGGDVLHSSLLVQETRYRNDQGSHQHRLDNGMDDLFIAYTILP